VNEPIVITASGAICAAGSAPEQIYQALREGRAAFAPRARMGLLGLAGAAGRRVESIDAGAIFEDRNLLKSVQRLRRTDLLGLYAASRAVNACGMIEYRATLDNARAAELNERTAVHTGCGGVAYHYQYDFLPALTAADGDLRAFGEKLGASANPTWLLQALPNNVLRYLGIAYGFKGANSCITNHSVSGTLAIIEAFHTLRAGDADRAVASGMTLMDCRPPSPAVPHIALCQR
jgi:3-oxoacyl-(acyl-carrier-protein) synthase